MDRRSYRKVYRRLWNHDVFKAFAHDDKVVALYLLSGPQTNRIGLFRLSCAQLGEEIGVRRPRVSVERVCEAMGWRYDAKASVVWIPSWWSWNPPGDRPTNFRGMLTDLNDVPATPLLQMFYAHIEDLPVALHQYIAVWAQREQSKGTARAQHEHSKASDEPQVEHIRLPDGDVRTETERKARTAADEPPRFSQVVENLPESHPPKAPKHPRSKDPSDDGNYRAILKIAHDVLQDEPDVSEEDHRGMVKFRCHALGIQPDLRDGDEATTLVRACVSAWTSHRLAAGGAR